MAVTSPVHAQHESTQPFESAHSDGAAAIAERAPSAQALIVDDADPSLAASVQEASDKSGSALRRGLPRVAGGEAWPPPGTAAAKQVNAAPGASEVSAAGAVAEVDPITVPTPAARPDASTSQLPARAGKAKGRITAQPDAKRRPSRAQMLCAIGFGVVAVSAVFLARAVLSLQAMQDFLTRFPGEYATPAPPGIAPWVGWQHFFNMFLMVLIIRSGLGVRHQKRPEAYWNSRNGKTKISLTLWLHQTLDILWLANGVVFVVLLFLTGHWARLIPTSWEVFPNALSAALQYLSFDWPVENGWNNYNSLQQLAYFTTVFLAAPLAAITGFRMSGLWPKRAQRLTKAYRVEWARAVHYPVMLYFVAFIVVHVALVVLTGLLRNLNHMYASQDTAGWLGFWIFLGSIVMIAAGWVLARTSLLSPVAGLFGKVSSR
ncbi:cytochrome b/b6 domain-containing protein [Arthrobacter sp. MA-N2]|uniref:cytochrome b/b6 domain-containing protein n=1 Tax=Arthrobacter sp. MA-N2 TaxID=1101188 RepID=UPI0004B12573